MKLRLLTAALVAVGSIAAEAAPKKVLVVTATKGFRHSSIATAENVIATLGETSGAFTVVDYVRGGGDAKKGQDDSDVMEKMTLAKLAQVDAVIFANTTGNLAIPDKDGFIKWVENGHALIGMHSCSDTFDGAARYQPFIDLLGAEFKTHGAQVQVDAYNQDPSHPATKHLGPVYTIFDEIYEFTDASWHRDRVHGLLTLDKHPQTLAPGDHPIAWSKDVGHGGKVFYTSLGHREDVWTSALYQQHILGGIKWALGLEKGSGKPTDTANSISADEKKAGFKLLFDGKTMNGWKYRRAEGPKSWSVQNGMLVNTLGKGEHGTDIHTEEKYKDFVVRFEYQVPPGSNSGFYLRGRYELQIFDNANKDGHAKGLNGDLYNVASCAVPAARKAGQWQQGEARMVGDKVTYILNGVKVHDNVQVARGTGGHLDDDNDKPGPVLLQGDHGAAGFRNIRIKRLD
jgi:type 1 glutamine amidotransferase